MLLQKKYTVALFGGLILLSFFMFLFRLERGAFLDYDEAIYAQVTHDTLASGNIWTLQHTGKNWYDKPPLYYWLAMVSDKIFPSTEFSYRFPAAILGVCAVVLTTLIAYELTGSWLYAVFAGFTLLTMGAFLEAGREFRLDVPVATSILFAFYSFLLGLRKAAWNIGIGVGVALAFFFKSVVALFAVFAILLWSAVHNKWQWLRSFYFWVGIGVMFCILGPWYIFQGLNNGSAVWNEYFYRHIYNRVGTNIIGGSVSNWDYIKYSFLYTFPWVLLFIPITFQLFYTLRQKTPTGRTSQKNLLALFLVIVFLTAIFSFAKTKLFYYLVPIFPFLALFITLGVQDILSRLNAPKRKWVIIVLALCAFAGFINTIWVGFRFENTLSTNQSISDDERTIGRLLRKQPQPRAVYGFEYYYFDTIRYYSGGRDIHIMKNDSAIGEPFFMVLSRPLYDHGRFPSEIVPLLHPEYIGDTTVLLKFDPS